MSDFDIKLSAHRVEIDDIDDQIVDLLNKRASIARKIGDLKREHKCEIYDPDRERELLQRLCQRTQIPLGNFKSIYRAIMIACTAVEENK